MNPLQTHLSEASSPYVFAVNADGQRVPGAPKAEEPKS